MNIIGKIVSVLIAVFILGAVLVSLPPRNFPDNITVHIGKDSSLSEISKSLSEKHIISSPLLFKIAVVAAPGPRGVLAGDYVFNKPQGLLHVASRLLKGDQGLERIKVTIPEGSTVKDIALILLNKIPNFNTPYFVKIASSSEGHLFPDTYFFFSNVSADEVRNTLENAFDEKIKSLAADIKLSKRKSEDIVIMASILEKEASSTADRAIISGILWKRIDIGMPLQVDATLVYIRGDISGPVSLDDTQINSPYNTYKYKGLPKGPISNPGLDALNAALHPTKTSYFYYLSDKRGNIHYASDHEGHLANREKYLNKI